MTERKKRKKASKTAATASAPAGLLPDEGRLRYKVLVVDDDADSRLVLREQLAQEGFTVIVAPSADEGFGRAVDSEPDVIVSDVAMPERDGYEFCRRLKGDRRTAAIPLIFVSGTRTDVESQVEGMETGADDFLAKPYSHRLLLAKLRAVLRRYAAPKDLGSVLHGAGAEIDVQARTVTVGGKRVDLTRKEFDLLTTLMRKPGRVLSVPYLLETVWGYDPAEYNEPHTVQTHLSTLRRKLGKPLAERIVSVPGVGYRFEVI